MVTAYSIGGTDLEHVNEIRDLGVILDTKLTFGPHVHQMVSKTNRALGVLIRSYQRATPGEHLNVSSVMVSYFAYVRSNMEYCSVIWSGAAAVHLDRIGRIEHKFLMWLNANCHHRSPSISYADLLKHFNLTSVSARLVQHDIMFVRNVLRGRIRSALLLQAFSLSVPIRATRQQASTLLHVPFARVNAMKNGLFTRLPRQLNRLVERLPAVDVFCDGIFTFRSSVRHFVAEM